MNQSVCCFGEILLRMSPDLPDEWLQQSSLKTYLGGAELNVATALAKWNMPVKYISALPQNYLSRSIIKYLQHKNIHTQHFIFSGERMGIYILPQGADLKHESVIYDRAHSSFSSLKPGTINWDSVFENVQWFHLTAISPALNAPLADICREALMAARAKNITTSIDLNYRSKLWQYTNDIPSVMEKLMPYCNVVMGNVWSAQHLLNIPVNEALLRQKIICGLYCTGTAYSKCHNGKIYFLQNSGKHFQVRD